MGGGRADVTTGEGVGGGEGVGFGGCGGAHAS